jgi:orotate phosphoribosyltransferase
MPLSGLLGVDVGFIRKSKNRGDYHALVIAEQEEVIIAAANGNRVVCVEDYVCSARSLMDVMVKIEGYGAASVMGASVANSHERNCIREIVNREGFHTFRR